MDKDKIRILDCTLRDGGYVNNWEFDADTARHIIEGLYQSGIRSIEIGILGGGGIPQKSTKFSDFAEICSLLADRHMDCRYAVMVNQSEIAGFDFPMRCENTVDIVRVAFYKNELVKAAESAKMLKDKGYEVFMQAMATFMYSDTELEQLIARVNIIKPKAFYMVDSFSNLYTEDVRHMKNIVLKCLDHDIDFGFHAHNNIQMAYANTVEFMKTETGRTLYVDGSIFGMGRGAGNVPTELLMEYLNKHGAEYSILSILDISEKYIKPIFEKNYWGYSHPYYLTASKDMNSVYSWYFMSHGIEEIVKLNGLLEKIEIENRYKLVRTDADTAMEEYE